MTHFMKLNPRPFAAIADGSKTIELRLNDEKRQKLRVGDEIVFSCTENPGRQVKAQVTALHLFSDFAALYRALPLERCGYTAEEAATASPRDMEKYYSPEDQKSCGVVGIELLLIGG